MDVLVFDVVGKCGFGDIDIIFDGSVFYVVNFFDNILFIINIVIQLLI